MHIFRVGQNCTFMGIYGVHTVILAGKSPYIRSYTVQIYGSGQPYIFPVCKSEYRYSVPGSSFSLMQEGSDHRCLFPMHAKIRSGSVPHVCVIAFNKVQYSP
jgi:hypothetical protein